MLKQIRDAQQDANDMMRKKFLQRVWQFEDLHKPEEAPAYIHRIKGYEVKHIQTIGDNLLLVNNAQDNIDVFSTESAVPLKTLDIQRRQMNCSVVTLDKIFIGCRDRRLFVFHKFNLQLVKVVELPECVHCLCTLRDYSQIAVGMSDGHIVILEQKDTAPEQPADQAIQISVAAQLSQIGGVWSICGINGDSELAMGTMSGVYIGSIM